MQLKTNKFSLTKNLKNKLDEIRVKKKNVYNLI